MNRIRVRVKSCKNKETGVVYRRLCWLADGELKSEGIGAVGKREADHLKSVKEAELNANPELAAGAGKMRLSTWVETYLSDRASDIEPATVVTIRATHGMLKAFFAQDAESDPDPLLCDIDKETAKRVYKWIRTRKVSKKKNPAEGEGKLLSIATVRKHMRNCKTLFTFAAEVPKQTGVVVNPFKQRTIKSAAPQMEKDWPDVTDEHFDKIADACPSMGWVCLFAFGHHAMTRSNDGRFVEWPDIRWESPARFIVKPRVDEHGRVKEDNTKHRRREVPIEPPLYKILRTAFEMHGDTTKGPCDGLPTDPSELSKMARLIVTRSGVPDYGDPLHTLRKCSENRWLMKYPAPFVAYWAGHSVKVQQRDYVKPPEAAFALASGDDKQRRIAQLRAELALLTNDPLQGALA